MDCSHKKVKKKLIKTKNEYNMPLRFIRETCVLCGRWISDIVPPNFKK